MNSIRHILCLFIIICATIWWVSANQTLTRGQTFIYFADKVDENIPDAYKYINLYYSWVDSSSPEWQALQKLVYLWYINNTNTDLWLNKAINYRTFEALASKILQVKISNNISDEIKRSTFVKENDLRAIEEVLENRNKNTNVIIPTSLEPVWIGEKSKILSDVYKTLNSLHYDRSNFTTHQIIDGAIKGAAESIGDKYTTYFPPTESKNFIENLDGNFEGIWAYIEMTSPWELIIISPIVTSPAEKAWLKWGDRIIAVDGKEITEKNSTNEVVSWIKWPKGTIVELTIQREWIPELFTVKVTRDTITIKDVEHKNISQNTYYIQIKSFWESVTKQFREALETISSDNQIRKIIIDVRNNPGGYLNEVAYMLSYFVPKGEPTIIIDNGNGDTNYVSLWFELLSWKDYELVLLQNSWSASASEILIWTLKDYYPNATIIWEKSFGKGSVQSLKNYYDGSTLKYTSAKWFTGKTKTWIDWVWISPDIEVILDEDMLRNEQIDTQLERAKRN